jgi:general secretion pathway protein L
MSILRIYFSSNWHDKNSLCPWALCDDSGAILNSGSSAIAGLPKSKECIAIVAPDRVLAVTAKVPPKSRRRWHESLRFVAEEFTLPDPENNHVVPGPVLTDGKMILAVVDKPWLSRIVEAFRAAKLPLRRMVAETFLPALKAQSWTLVWNGHSGFLRTGTASGQALDNGDSTSAPLALHMALNSFTSNSPTSLPEKIELRFSLEVPEEQQILPQWNLMPAVLVTGPVWNWQQAPIASDSLNLLWGEFAPSARLSEWWPHLRPIALILLVLLGVESLGTNLQWAMLAGEKKSLAQDMARMFRSAFGDSHTLVNPVVQMQRNLSGLRHKAGLPDEGDFLPLLDAAAPTFATLPEGSLLGLHYESGRLDVDIKLSSGNDFSGLRQRLQNKGLGVQLGDIRNVGNGAEARLTLLPGDHS